jgi:hypothetical protein
MATFIGLVAGGLSHAADLKPIKVQQVKDVTSVEAGPQRVRPPVHVGGRRASGVRAGIDRDAG